MSFFENPDTLKLLQNLLKHPNEQTDSSDDDYPKEEQTHKFEVQKKIVNEDTGTEINVKNEHKTPSLNKDDNDYYFNELQTDNDEFDYYKIPEYSIFYKQNLGVEDVFLQMNNKTAASSSCEDMIVEILLPEETTTSDSFNLSISENEINLKTSTYRLKLPLVQNIDPDKGYAKFDTEKQCLTITLRMNRELDFINF